MPAPRFNPGSTASPARLGWCSQVASASALDCLNCAVSGASRGRGGGRKIRTRCSREKRGNRWTPSPDGSRRSAWSSPPHHAVLSRGKSERWPAAGWGGGRQSGGRDPQNVRSGRATVPRGASGDRGSCVAGNPACGSIRNCGAFRPKCDRT